MDRSLDEIIGERPRGGGGRRPPPTGPRPRGPPPRDSRRDREDYPRDGVRKPRYDDRRDMDSDWVHDRFEDERYDRRRAPIDDRYGDEPRASAGLGTKLRVDNLHYDLTEEDLRSLFERKGLLMSVKLLYDRHDRSTGTAYVIYEDHRDARDAVADFDGQNANGQPIKISIVPQGPSGGDRFGGAPSGPPVRERSMFDRMAPRSMFDRMDPDALARRDDSRDGGRRRRDRSDSPRNGRGAVPEHIDRYVPGGARGSRSPIRRRGTPRESGRRPGERRERAERPPRKPRTDEEGRPIVGGRPKKTAEELDAEMEDYFNKNTENGAPATNGNGAAPAAAAVDEDEDMVL